MGGGEGSKSKGGVHGLLPAVRIGEVRGDLAKTLPDVSQRLVREGKAEDLGEGPDDLPVFTGIAWRGNHRPGELDTTLGVHVGSGLLGVGGAREDNVGKMGTHVTVMALVDDKGALGDVLGADIISAEEVEDRGGLGGGIDSRHKAHIEGGGPGGSPVEHRDAVPVLRHEFWVRLGEVIQGGKDKVGIGAGGHVGANNNHGTLGVLPELGKGRVS